jgi:hypothetical protein
LPHHGKTLFSQGFGLVFTHAFPQVFNGFFL